MSRHVHRSHVEAIQANGHRINVDGTLQTWKVPATSEYKEHPNSRDASLPRPDYMWMEEGSSSSGFQHTQVKNKPKSYIGKGTPADQQREKLPMLAEAHTTVGRHIGFQNPQHTTPRPVMATYFEGQVHRDGADMSLG